MYLLEVKKGYRTSYTQNKLYLKIIDKDIIHVVVNKEEATVFKKGNLANIYKLISKERLIKHHIKNV